jgi:hypothetical protein
LRIPGIANRIKRVLIKHFRVADLKVKFIIFMLFLFH